MQIRDGDTGYFYHTSRQTAKKLIYLLEKPKAAEAMGKRGRAYVEQRFLLPDRIADYLMAINMIVSRAVNKEVSAEAIISFSPWFKLSKRKRVQFFS